MTNKTQQRLRMDSEINEAIANGTLTLERLAEIESANQPPARTDDVSPNLYQGKGDSIIRILASHAHDETDNREDAQRIAVRAGRCGSPFTYQVIEVAPNHFLVVNHIDASLYRDLLAEVTR